MLKKFYFQSILVILLNLLALHAVADEKKGITLFAAASLTDALTEIALNYEKEQKVTVQKSFASSSTLAKQIEKGAPADIFIAADMKWMQYLQDKNFIQPETKSVLLSNQLVLIAPKDKNLNVQMDATFNFAEAFKGKLCTGETESVPIGIYAKQALKNLNWWDAIKARIVGTQDVRAALVFVERSECDAGIVYATDAKISDKVVTVATFPETSHEKIVYPLALVKGASADSAAFYQYLISTNAKPVFAKYGFITF